jgi:hypothetical protein
VFESRKGKAVVLCELTCPWEENAEWAHERKLTKYEGLKNEIASNGWLVKVFAVEVGCRGFASNFHLKHKVTHESKRLLLEKSDEAHILSQEKSDLLEKVSSMDCDGMELGKELQEFQCLLLEKNEEAHILSQEKSELCVGLKEKSVELQESQRLLQEKSSLLQKTTVETSHRQKRYAGKLSGSSRKITKLERDMATSAESSTPLSLNCERVEVTRRMKGNSQDTNAIFLGKEYYGNASLKSGRESTFVRLYSPSGTRKANSSLSDRAILQRAELASKFLALLSWVSFQDVEDGVVSFDQVSPILRKLLNGKFGDFGRFVDGKLAVEKKMLDVSEVVDLKVLLDLPMYTVRRLRTILTNFGFPILPSEPKMRKEMKNRVIFMKFLLKNSPHAWYVEGGEGDCCVFF